jgi:hypothetical protein
VFPNQAYGLCNVGGISGFETEPKPVINCRYLNFSFRNPNRKISFDVSIRCFSNIVLHISENPGHDDSVQYLSKHPLQDCFFDLYWLRLSGITLSVNGVHKRL